MTCPTCSFIPIEPILKHSPRVEELLASNTPPQVTEHSEFRVIIDQYNAYILDLDGKIAKAAEVLENLTRARGEAQSHLKDYHALVHPMRSLPSEIVSEIFQHSMRHYAYFDDIRYPPWTLTHVSCRWRAIGLSSPNLWSHIAVDFDYLQPAHMYRLGQYLERSSGCPLSIHLVGGDDMLDHPILPLLEASTPRCKKLFTDPSDVSLPFLHDNDFPELQSLEVMGNDRVALDIVLPSAYNVPHLRSLSVCLNDFLGTSIGTPSPEITLFVSQIMVELVNGFPLVNLPVMRSLRRLDIRLFGYSVAIESAIFLPELSHLSIRRASSASLHPFCSFLEAPVLTDLAFDFDSGISFPTFRHPLQHLTKFTVIATDKFVTPTVSQRLLDFLSQMPNVEELILRRAISTAELMAGLALPSHSSVVKLPRLRILDISDCQHHLGLGIEHICTLLESRRQGNPMGCAHLEVVRVPRWVYLNGSERWKAIRRTMKMECAFTLKDDDGLRFEY